MRNLTSRQIATLHQFGDAPFSLAAIQSLFPDKKSYRVEVSLVQAGILVRLKRDLFVLSEQILGHSIDRYVVSNRLCTPSYVSREAALSHEGLIPEHVVNMTCSRLGRSVEFETPIGCFQYAAVDSSVYAIGLCEMASGENRFLCATPEKALYDLVVLRPHLNIRSRVEMRRFLFEDLRLSSEDHSFDATVFDELLANGRKKRMVQLMKEILCHGSV